MLDRLWRAVWLARMALASDAATRLSAVFDWTKIDKNQRLAKPPASPAEARSAHNGLTRDTDFG